MFIVGSLLVGACTKCSETSFSSVGRNIKVTMDWKSILKVADSITSPKLSEASVILCICSARMMQTTMSIINLTFNDLSK